MFYCDPCADKNIWPTSIRKSRGPCEICNEMANCNDLPCSALPARKGTSPAAPPPIQDKAGRFTVSYCPSCWQQAGSPPVETSMAAECTVCGVKAICLECKVTIKIPPKWPQFIKVYVHGSRDSMFEHGEKIGLTGEALSLFSHACSEICVKLEVQEDGSAKIIGVD